MNKNEIMFTEVPSFNDAQINRQVKKQLEFLRAVYPYAIEDRWTEGTIEIRPIKRDKDDNTFYRSWNSFRLLDKDEEFLLNYMKQMNGKGVCLYYSLFAFDRDLEVIKSDGKKFQKGKINNQNALFTSVLAMDLDCITEKEYNDYKSILKRLDIETWDVMSGHGYQLIILLDQKIYDKEILGKFTNLLISRGFKADPAITDCARVMRLPYTFNCKALDKGSRYSSDGQIVPVKVISQTGRRYNLIDIFKKIGSLPVLIEESNPVTDIDLSSIVTVPILKSKPKVEIKEVANVEVKNLKSIYSMINFEALEDPVKKMLNGSQEGLRNQVMLFLIPFLRNSLGLSLETIKQVMQVWGSKCTPSYSSSFICSEVDRIYAYGLKGKHGKYTNELAKAYGFFELGTYKRNNKVLIPNEVFEDVSDIKDGAFRIYLAMHMYKIINGQQNFTTQEIVKLSGIQKRCFYNNINDLLVLGYVCKKRSNRRAGKEYEYYINPYFNSTKGFTLLETAVIKLMQLELTNGEAKLYCYLAYMIGNTKGSCWASQKYLAKSIGKTQSAVSKMTDSMNVKKFITKVTKTTNNVKHTVYNLNY